jgi:uncharacterized protein (DUF2141 family)
MKMKKNLFATARFIAVILGVLTCISFTAPTGTVTVEVTNLRSNNGYVLVSLYDTPESFPKNGEKAVGKGKVKITGGKATITFKNMPQGKYAAAILHDENDNLKMDFNDVGIPQEGYGFSNNAKGFLGPPSFSKAAFNLNGPVKNISIKATYF